MAVGVVRIACRLPLAVLWCLAVLLALPGTVLLGEVRDTLANPMRAVGQHVLTALHLRLDLLAERPIDSGGRCPGAEDACRDARREGCHGRFAFDHGRNCGYESGCHAHPRIITSSDHVITAPAPAGCRCVSACWS
jgi:hypothetical protein